MLAVMKNIVISLIFGLICICHEAAAEQVSKQDAVAIALRNTPGKVLSVKTDKGQQGKIYYIKLLMKDGRVKTIKVDAETGRVLG